MKSLPAVLLLAALAISPAMAAKKEKAPNAGQAEDVNKPAPVRVSDFMAENLEKILGPIDNATPPPRAELSKLRASVGTDQGALVLCSALEKCATEREAALSKLSEVSTARMKSAFGPPRKVNPNDTDLARERDDAKAQQKEEAQKKAAAVAKVKSDWIGRAAVLRQGIQALAEKQAKAESPK